MLRDKCGMISTFFLIYDIHDVVLQCEQSSFVLQALMYFLLREWAVTACWVPLLCLMLVVCVKETTPPARITKDSTSSSIILTVGHVNYIVQLICFGDFTLKAKNLILIIDTKM